MQNRPIRRGVAGLVLGLLSLLVATSCGEEPKSFPGAFPGSHTDVSSRQAFRDFDIHVPGSAKVVGYYAWSADDEYPMAAVLRMPCSAVSGFVSGNGLRTVPDLHPDTVDVEVLARQHDWSDDGKDARYLRPEARGGHVGVLVHRTGTECKMYLHT